MYELMTLRTLTDLMGRPFIEYACNLSAEELSGRLDETISLSVNKERALQLLVYHASRSYQPANSLNENRQAIIGYFSDYEQRFTDTITLGKIRELAGGDLIVPKSRKPLIKVLTILARDAYPFYLVPITPPDPEDAISAAIVSSLHYFIRIYNHPLNKEVVSLLPLEPVINRLFPVAEDGKSTPMAYTIRMYNSGTSSRLETDLFATNLIKQAFKSCAIRGNFSCRDFIDQTLRNFDQLKELITNSQAEVPLVVSVSGIKLSEGQTLTTPWGVLRSATNAEKLWLRSPYRVLGRDVEVIFETKYRISMLFGPRIEDIEYPVDEAQSDRETEEKLAIISALPQIAISKTIRIEPLVSIAIPPFESGESMSYPWILPSPIKGALTSSEIHEIEELAKKVNNSEYERIIISFRRLASAVKRTDVTDGFIDLIIIWENLFGTESGEVSFRISLAISKILHDDESYRHETFLVVKALYKARSNIVHGSQHYSIQEVWGFWNDALEITTKVLNKIFNERTELLTFKSDTRSRKLGLG